MRTVRVGVALCCVVLCCWAAVGLGAQEAEKANAPTVPATVLAALGVEPLLQQLAALQQKGDTSSLMVVNLRQQVLQRVLEGSFEVDSVLGRVDTEASYASEDRYTLQVRGQRDAAMLNLVTLAASGALGAAGSAMQLTRGLNHAGTALSAAAGGTALVLSGVQLKGVNPKLATRSPYNMLAQVLGRTPNAESRYPPLVTAYLESRRPDGRTLTEALTAAWQRLHRLQANGRGDGASVEDLTGDSGRGLKLTVDQLADREAMLRDLHAAIILLRTDLQAVLFSTEQMPAAAAPAATP